MPDRDKVFGRPSYTVVVGHILPSLEALGHAPAEDGEPLFTIERSIPRILASLKLAKSVSEVKRNRPDLDIQVSPNTTHFVKFGRHLLFIVGGFYTQEEHDQWDNVNINKESDVE